MTIKALFIFSLFLAAISFCLGYQVDPQEQFEQCQQPCVAMRWGSLQQQQCQLECRYQKMVEQRMRYRQCLRSCDQEPPYGGRQQQCRRQCGQRLSYQERQQLCQLHCERHETGDWQHRCQSRCQQQFEQGRVIEQDIMMNSRRDPEQKFEQRQQSCRYATRTTMSSAVSTTIESPGASTDLPAALSEETAWWGLATTATLPKKVRATTTTRITRLGSLRHATVRARIGSTLPPILDFAGFKLAS